MNLEIKRQERENNQSLLRRFTKGLQRSGILIRARKERFFQRPKSAESKKKAALRRVELKKKYKKLDKLRKPK
ncbi:MAG: 30S ribosomal protein S21 [Patescibacteria group bacterium]|nr:30S ribosomal protein S21 [Patescibacteria group bacterium]